jgi:hypothetical protein
MVFVNEVRYIAFIIGAPGKTIFGSYLRIRLAGIDLGIIQFSQNAGH